MFLLSFAFKINTFRADVRVHEIMPEEISDWSLEGHFYIHYI